MSVVTAGCYLCVWPTAYKSEVYTSLSFGSINLPEWLTQLKETYYLLDYSFIIKVNNSGIVRWNRWIGEGIQEGQGASMLSLGMPLTRNRHMFTDLKVLWTLSFGFLWILYCTGMIDYIIGHGQLIQTLAPLYSPEIRLELKIPTHKLWLVFLVARLHLWVLSKSQLINRNLVILHAFWCFVFRWIYICLLLL